MAAIAFVTLGDTIPHYFRIALYQARLFNDGPVYLVADAKALAAYPLDPALAITTVARETLPMSQAHQRFLAVTRLDTGFRQGFWRYVVERFFVLEAAMARHDLHDVIHLEGDNLIYADAAVLTRTLHELYGEVAVPFDHDQRAVAGMIYFKSPTAIARFAAFITAMFEANPGAQINDMQLLGFYRSQLGNGVIDSLPVVPSSYDPPYRNLMGEASTTPALYAMNFDRLRAIFDANALGQYIDGIDPRNTQGRCSVGFVNETAMYQLDRYRFGFRADGEKRLIPHLIDGKHAWPIVNLHVHSKNLERFLSKPMRTLPAAPKPTPIADPRSIRADDIITSERLQALAELTVADRHSYDFNTSVHLIPEIKIELMQGDRNKLLVDGPAQIERLQGGQSLFVHTHLIPSFARDVLPSLTRPFVLISHSSDDKVTEKDLPLLEDVRLVHWFAQNALIAHPKLTALPIGLANRQWPHGDVESLAEVMALDLPKDETLYVNINVRTNSAHRGKVLAALSGKAFVRHGEIRPYRDYLADMARSRFCCSPQGNGTDCHRTWEALYLGMIPLVDRAAWVDGFDELPIVPVDDWAQVDAAFLARAAIAINGRRTDFRKLTMRYWRAAVRARLPQGL